MISFKPTRDRNGSNARRTDQVIKSRRLSFEHYQALMEGIGLKILGRKEGNPGQEKVVTTTSTTRRSQAPGTGDVCSVRPREMYGLASGMIIWVQSCALLLERHATACFMFHGRSLRIPWSHRLTRCSYRCGFFPLLPAVAFMMTSVQTVECRTLAEHATFCAMGLDLYFRKRRVGLPGEAALVAHTQHYCFTRRASP